MRKSETFEDRALALGKIEHKYLGHVSQLTDRAFGTRFRQQTESLNKSFNTSEAMLTRGLTNTFNNKQFMSNPSCEL